MKKVLTEAVREAFAALARLDEARCAAMRGGHRD